MKKLTIVLCATLAFCTCSVYAAELETPPVVKSVKTQPMSVPQAKSETKTGSFQDFRLEPNEADIAAARKARESRSEAQPPVMIAKNGTKIETITDQNNHMTSIRVTPSQTEIPYTMRNQADRPIDNGPASNMRSTLGTPKFIELKM